MGTGELCASSRHLALSLPRTSLGSCASLQCGRCCGLFSTQLVPACPCPCSRTAAVLLHPLRNKFVTGMPSSVLVSH